MSPPHRTQNSALSPCVLPRAQPQIHTPIPLPRRLHSLRLPRLAPLQAPGLLSRMPHASVAQRKTGCGSFKEMQVLAGGGRGVWMAEHMGLSQDHPPCLPFPPQISTSV